MPASSTFDIFPHGTREWCACRADGLVCGYFTDRAGAIRFARRESCGAGTIRICETCPEGAPIRAAA